VDDIKGHDNTCMYKVIECDVEGCNHTCQRKDMINHLSDMNVKLHHMELKYTKKMEQMETKYEGKLEECEKKYDTKLKLMEQKYKKKFTEYENKLQEYENRLQTMGGDDNKKRKLSNPGPDQFHVMGCGIAEINGVYSRDGDYDNAPKYARTAQYRGREEVFSLYRFEEAQWFISIVGGSQPSHSDDTDFYVADVDGPLPPADNWEATVRNGISPPPEVYPIVRVTGVTMPSQG